jgi:RNA polymerase sigma-70 factor (ECF subfamily)
MSSGTMKTSLGLLRSLRRPPGEDQRAWNDAWARFVDLYAPLLSSVARRFGFRGDDAEELVQSVLVSLLGVMRDFDYDPAKSFRAYLRRAVRNKVITLAERSRLTVPLTFADEPCALPELEEAEYRHYVIDRALILARSELPQLYPAFHAHVVEGRAADDVAKELGLSRGEVYRAKYKVQRHLRERLDGFLH